MKFTRFWSTAIIIAFSVLAFVTISSADYDKAYELYKAKKYSEAIPMLEDWCNKYPKDPRGGYTLAQCYVKTKQTPKALERLNVVFEHHPEHAPSQFLAGMIKLKNSPDSALKHFKRAVEEKSDNYSYQYYYGSALMVNKDYATAEKALKTAVELKPNSGKAQLDLGRVLLLNDKAGEAVSHLTIASKGKKDKSSALYYLGLAQYKMQDFAAAETALDQASKLSSDDAKIFYNLGLAREAGLGENKTVEACQPMIDAYSKAVELDGNPDYKFRLGNAYETAARSIYSKTAGNKAMSDQALSLLDKAEKAYQSAGTSEATTQLQGVATMINNIKNPQIIEEEVTE